MKPIKKLEERLVYSNLWVKLYYDQVQFPDGRVGDYTKIVENETKCGVAIIPIKNMMIGLVYQFRYPVKKEMWEIPRGFGELSDPRKDAIRELKEETAIKIEPEALIDLGIIYPNSGILATKVRIFAAMCENVIQEKSGGYDEVADFRWFPIEKVLSLIDTGAITDSFTLCTLFRARLRGII